MCRIWEESEYEVEAELCSLLAADVTHDVKCVRDASAGALSSAIAVHLDHVQETLTSLLEVFEEKLYVRIFPHSLLHVVL